MSKSKLYRYDQIKELPNVIELSNYQEGDYANIRGHWLREIFLNENPVTLELACGKGDYILALAKKFPHRNFVGVDIKGDRIWKGARRALDQGLTNVRFLRVFIDHIENYFGPEEVSEIWITFPDPYSSRSKERKRLTSRVFLKKYRRIIKPGHPIHLKTDSKSLFDFTLEILKSEEATIHELVADVYAGKASELTEIRTYYEKKHIAAGKTIMYVRFSLKDRDPIDLS